MPAMVRDGEPFDPDTVKVPQSPDHERVLDTLKVAATQLLGSDVELFSDMNWYPPDGGNAVAPDLMVLPAGVVVATPNSRTRTGRPKSYRQDELDGPAPSVALEVMSDSDTTKGMFQKLRRYQRLGSVAYLLTITSLEPGVYRFGPNDRTLVDWVGRPIPELGGLRVDVVDGRTEVTVGDGVQGDSLASLVDSLITAGQQQAEAERQQAEARAEALARQLKALGVEPEQ